MPRITWWNMWCNRCIFSFLLVFQKTNKLVCTRITCNALMELFDIKLALLPLSVLSIMQSKPNPTQPKSHGEECQWIKEGDSAKMENRTNLGCLEWDESYIMSMNPVPPPQKKRLSGVLVRCEDESSSSGISITVVWCIMQLS